MAKEELITLEGLVTELLPDARFRVQLDTGHTIVAYTAGRMKKHRIKTLAGDRVTVEMSPYDLEKGRLVFRHKDERAAAEPEQPRRRRAGRCSAAADRPARALAPHFRKIIRSAEAACANRASLQIGRPSNNSKGGDPVSHCHLPRSRNSRTWILASDGIRAA